MVAWWTAVCGSAEVSLLRWRRTGVGLLGVSDGCRGRRALDWKAYIAGTVGDGDR